MKGLNVTVYFNFFTFVCWRRIIRFNNFLCFKHNFLKVLMKTSLQLVEGNHWILYMSSCFPSTSEVLDLDTQVEEEA